MPAARLFLSGHTPDLVIVDLNMSDGDGLSLLPGQFGVGDFPFLVLTGEEDVCAAAAAEAMRLGALDYVVKSDRFFAELPAITKRVLQRWQQVLDRRAADAAQRRSEARLSAILHASPDAIVSCDKAGRIQLFNQAAEETFGYSADQVIGRNLSLLIPERCRGRHATWLSEFAENPGGSMTMGKPTTITARHRDGREFPASAAITRVLVADEVVLTVILRDLTEDIQREATLRQAQKMEAIGHLASGIAHDFNNVLAVIRANMGLLLEGQAGQTDSHRREMVLDSLQAAQQGARMVDRLLAFSRNQAVSQECIRLNQLAEGMLWMLKTTLSGSVDLQLDLDPAAWACEADAAQLEGVLLNLCINARDAIRDDGRIVIETSNVHCTATQTPSGDPITPGDYVALTVRDNGVGMSQGVLSQMFTPFFTTKAPGNGSGLGLSMVHGTIRQAKGHVWVESELGEGTSISVRLPRLPRKQTLDETPHLESGEGRPPPLTTPDALRGIKVLVVDDDVLCRRSASRNLARFGVDCVGAGSADEALRLLERDAAVDAVLSDHSMPGSMTGLRLLLQVQRRWPDVASILITGSAHGLSTELTDSIVPVVTKPYDPGELVETLRCRIATLKKGGSRSR